MGVSVFGRWVDRFFWCIRVYGGFCSCFRVVALGSRIERFFL